MTAFEIAVLVILGVIVVQLAMIICFCSWLTETMTKGLRILILQPKSDVDEADWWKDNDNQEEDD